MPLWWVSQTDVFWTRNTEEQKAGLITKVSFMPWLSWNVCIYYLDRVKRIWYLSPMRAAKVQASLRIRAVSPEPSLLAHTSSESRGTFRQKTRSLALLNCWACAVKVGHDGMLEDTNSPDGAHFIASILLECKTHWIHFCVQSIELEMGKCLWPTKNLGWIWNPVRSDLFNENHNWP